MPNNNKNKTITGSSDKINRVALAIISILLVTNTFAFYLYKKEADPSFCGDYSFINPRFKCGNEAVVDKKGYAELKFRLNAYIEEKKNKGEVDIVAVWFRDLESGPTFGINDRINFIPASLLKLPLVLTFYELAEHDPSLLEREIIYGEITPVPKQTFLPINPAEKGKQYTINELIHKAIVESDNLSAQLLYEYLEKSYPGELSNTYRNLGILEPGHDLNASGVNTKEYGSIFRMLYNISFLNIEMSEKLLLLLSQTRFEDGLRVGVPADIKIAHKFGERFLDDGSRQLHDCGIVYYPENPYQICIMTRGDDFNELSTIIQEVSRQVYEEFDSRKL